MMRTSEWIVLGYLAWLLTCAIARRLPPRHVRTMLVPAIGVAASIGLAASVPQTAVVNGFRDWLPGVYLLTGYWLSGLFRHPPSRRLEERLERFDRRLGLDGTRDLGATVPRLVLEYLEGAYLFVYALVPVALLAIVAFGEGGLADHFWTVVLAACYGSYSTLVLFTTRPPRAKGEVRGKPADARILLRRVNLFVLDRGSIQVNTLPSGHAAGALASALVVAEVSPVAGAVFTWLAFSVAAGSVIGRYHYAIDSILGLLLAVVAWLVFQR
ncbi:MAG: phosphatase PAP2 family protein [Vicinamibacterales bacterium]